MNMTLEIDELVLHGFPSEVRYAVAEALEQELAELFRGQASGGPGNVHVLTRHPLIRSSSVASQTIDALPRLAVALPPGATPQQVGRLVGRELFRALEQGT